jgi:hypothetical protein
MDPQARVKLSQPVRGACQPCLPKCLQFLTLFPEAVAEHTKKPLLIIPTGELGSQLDAIQTEIKKLIRYAMMWKAIVLIDEADVFLEARQNGGAISLEKNGLVAGDSNP